MVTYLLWPMLVNVILHDQTNLILFVAPGIPHNLRIRIISSKSLRVNWNSPSDPNGIITEYELKWRLVEDDKQNKVVVGSFDNTTLTGNQQYHTITNLRT